MRKILFTQERVGKDGKIFVIWKFRTVGNGSQEMELAGVRPDDIQNWFCTFLRDSHLDELPNLWNVLRGDMSMTGPRPRTLFLAQERERDIPGFGKRCDVMPGMISWGKYITHGESPTLDRDHTEFDIDMHRHINRAWSAGGATLLLIVGTASGAWGIMRALVRIIRHKTHSFFGKKDRVETEKAA
tara:strand:+ start:333 stop:890 length:558 start_codon:yes stop_codon:yes gene_type:complete